MTTLFAGSVYAPTIPNPYLSDWVIIQGNSIKAGNISSLLETREKEEFKEWIRKKYPEMADLLICIWGRESSFGKNMIGDKGNAFGHFQIWLKLHPVSYECAMDFECSLNYTAEMIKRGKGNLWTTYSKCIK